MDFSYQLYSSRNFPPLDATLTKLAALGYRQVEGFGGLYTDLDGLAAGLRASGLAMPTAHMGLSQLKDTSTALRIAETLGIRFLYCPAIPKEDRSPDESKWVELGETLAKLGETFRKNGVGFGWHNHDFEFRPLANGRLPMDILLETAAHNEWEMDVAWLVRSGQDPVEWLRKHGKRINAVHVKDLAPAGTTAEDGWADVGQGTMDWASLATVVKTYTNARYWVMEHDNPSDAERFATRSLAAARAWK